MGRSMAKRPERQKLLNAVQGATQTVPLINPNKQAQQAQIAEGASLQIGVSIYSPMAASILMGMGKDEGFPTQALAVCANEARNAARIYLASQGMQVPGVQVLNEDNEDPEAEKEEDSADDGPKAEKPTIITDV